MGFEHNDICVIMDISVRSSHYPNKNSFIGKRVKFISYYPRDFAVTCNDFIQCEISVIDTIRTPSKTIWEKQKMIICGVKQKKIGNSNSDAIRM